MTVLRLALSTIALLSLCSSAFSAGGEQRHSRSRDWLDRPWEIRYVLFVASASSMAIRVRLARESNVAPERPGRATVYLDAEEMFEPTEIFDIPRADPLAAVHIEFDRNGKVGARNKRLDAFTAKRNLLDDLVLVKNPLSKEKPYYFADWSQGIPGDVSFSPAVCTTADDARYEDGWDKNDNSDGSFGCREWTAQLYDRAQPYIDVTSYAKHGSFVGSFVGWSRFSDPVKPIIGLQGKTWLCLHDCPAGEKPGAISNIRRWAAKHHFPVPVPPPRQPMYPNSNYKDDLTE